MKLLNGLRAFWVEQFEGDAERLDLALIQVAGFVQPNSSRPLESQVSAQLARIVADKRDRDARYQRAASGKAAGPQKSRAPSKILAALEEIQTEMRAKEAMQ